MPRGIKLSIIIPVYNEKNTIKEIIDKVESFFIEGIEKEIIIVDDGSTDGTRDILKKLTGRYKIIYHPENRGKGVAIRTALESVSGDYIIIQDADLEYDPRDYKKILECALRNNAEVVYGSRRLNTNNRYSHFSFYLGGVFLNWLTNFLYGIRITDEWTCYKLFKTETLKKIPLKAKRFEFCPEVTVKIAKKKIKIYEIPINYFPRHKKEGKKIKWWDGIKTIWLLIKYKFIE